MRKVKKGLTALVFAFVASVFVFAFAACSERPDTCAVHKFGEWQVTTEPGCGTPGTKTRKCSVCDFEETDTIPATGNHTYESEWTHATDGNCKDPGTETRPCAVCGHIDTRDTVKNPDVHTEWSEWTTDRDATCESEGHEFRVCFGCGKKEERDIPIDENAHVFGAFSVTAPSTCSKKGSRVHTCALCGTDVSEELPLDPENHNYKPGTSSSPATCVTEGVLDVQCADCGAVKHETTGLDMYNHEHELVNGVCPDCHGMLSAERVVDNTSGKGVDTYGYFFNGDFKLVYEYYAKAGANGEWHNFIFKIAPGLYIDGELTESAMGRIMLIPFSKDKDHYCGPDTGYLWWKYYGINVGTTWFFDENGTDLIYQDCVKKGVNVVTTLERVGNNVNVRMVMTARVNGKNYDCVVTTRLAYPGIDDLYVGITGESSSLTLKQFKVEQGTFSSPTFTETGTQAMDESVTLDNSHAKNVQGVNHTYVGDFDVEYDLTLVGDQASDWDSWIMYMFKDADDFTVASEHKLFYSGTANGNNSELYAPTVKKPTNADGSSAGYYNYAVHIGNLSANIQNSKAKIRIVRKNGQITVYGYGYKDDGSVIVYYVDPLTVLYDGTLTLRFTSEDSVVTVTGLTVYKGKVTAPDGGCITHSYGEWQTITDPTCGGAGVKKRTCSVCNHFETADIPATGEHVYNEWYTEREPQCGTPGLKKRTCKNCDHFETEEIPAGGEHSFGEWQITKEVSCTEDGEKQRTCSLCGEVEKQTITSSGHSYGEWVTTAATCIAAGSRSKECSTCHDIQTETLPVDKYNHAHALVDGVCPDCHGLLTEQKNIDNSGVKLTDFYDLYVSGDFELEYRFKNISGGVDYNWDNFILVVGQAQYAGGKLVHPSVRNSGGGNRGDFETIPYMKSSDASGHFGLFWNRFGNSMNTSWFHNDATGAEVPFADAMKTDPGVVATITRAGNLVTLTYVITADMGSYTATCTVDYNIYVAAAQAVYLGLSGEECALELDQVKLLSGKLAPETKTESGENLIDEPQTLANLGANVKNVQGINVTADSGDFDIEFCFESADQADRSDWDNWILYMFKDSDDLTVGGGHKVYWSMTANGAEPENYATVYQDVNWSCFYKRNYGDFGKQLIKHCTFNLRIVRKAGFITVIGDGYLDDEDTPFVRWAYNTYKITYDGKLTVRLTSQNSTLTVNDIICYAGTATGTDGLCVVHRFGEWSEKIAPTCGAVGTEHRVCSKCNKEETRDIPATGLHEYSDDGWETVTEPQCGDSGSERRKCKNCDYYETRDIPATGSHTYGEWTTASVATCVAKATETHTCSVCNKVETREVGEIALYNHAHELVGGVCPDCHGMLTAAQTIDNYVEGVQDNKFKQTFERIFEGNFTVRYTFVNVNIGGRGEWDNFLLGTAAAEYLNGKLVMSGIGRMDLIPWNNTDYGKFWEKSNSTYNTTWFHYVDGNKEEPAGGFQACIKNNPTVVITVTKVANRLTAVFDMSTTINDRVATATVTITLNNYSANKVWLGLSCQDGRLELSQVALLSGAVAPETSVEQGMSVISEATAYNNPDGKKNVAGNNIIFDSGDFDVEYRFKMNGNPASDWHSWIMYLFKDSDDLVVGDGHKLYWSMTANGAEPEQYALFHDMNHSHFLKKIGDSAQFGNLLATATIQLRVIRVGGSITVFGQAIAEGETSPFAYWAYMSFESYNDKVTVRLTSENSTLTLNEMIVYNGNVVTETKNTAA